MSTLNTQGAACQGENFEGIETVRYTGDAKSEKQKKYAADTLAPLLELLRFVLNLPANVSEEIKNFEGRKANLICAVSTAFSLPAGEILDQKSFIKWSHSVGQMEVKRFLQWVCKTKEIKMDFLSFVDKFNKDAEERFCAFLEEQEAERRILNRLSRDRQSTFRFDAIKRACKNDDVMPKYRTNDVGWIEAVHLGNWVNVTDAELEKLKELRSMQIVTHSIRVDGEWQLQVLFERDAATIEHRPGFKVV